MVFEIPHRRQADAVLKEGDSLDQDVGRGVQIAALLDKRDPQRNAATGVEANATPSLGTASGTEAQLSQSEIDALRARLMALWNPPVGMQDASQTQVTIRIRFRKDGTLAIGPQVLTTGSGAARMGEGGSPLVPAALHHAAA